MLVFVLSCGWGFSILSGALALTMFNIPILVRVIQQALEAVPRDQRDAALALGLTRWEACVHVLVPAAMGDHAQSIADWAIFRATGAYRGRQMGESS